MWFVPEVKIVLCRKSFDRMHSRSLWLSKSVCLSVLMKASFLCARSVQTLSAWIASLDVTKESFLWIFKLSKKYFKVAIIRDALSFTWGVKIPCKGILRGCIFL